MRISANGVYAVFVLLMKVFLVLATLASFFWIAFSAKDISESVKFVTFLAISLGIAVCVIFCVEAYQQAAKEEEREQRWNKYLHDSIAPEKR